ncbi:hypothetical protein FQR65_LT03348 [Abscondita terminalis]|nr:hypothetical protein FQR65_LT03348 [Abscondita terminalis]
MGKKKKKKGIVIDGVDTTPMTREQIESLAIAIKEQNDKEREERNFFQLERDKLRTFWEITRNELEEARAKLRNKDQQIQDSYKSNADELRFYRQKVKYMQFEFQNDIAECASNNLTSLKNATDDHLQQEAELLNDKKELKKRVLEQENARQDQIKELKLQYAEQLHQARQDFENRSRELELKYDKKFSTLTQDLNTIHKMEMTEVEERKNTQISELTRNHEANFNEMKNYYNDITLNNLALISSLKDQMESLKSQNERMTRQVSDLSAETKKLQEPLKAALADVADYKRQLHNYEKDKIALANTTARLRKTKKELDNLTWANSALELRFDLVEAERNELKKRFTSGILEIQQKSALKSETLQRRIELLHDQDEVKNGIISVLDKYSSFDLDKVYKTLTTTLSEKNSLIKNLQYEVARVSKAHDDLVQTYEEKLIQYGVPKAELGFQPIKYTPANQTIRTKGPAGLVTKNK